MAYNNPLLDYVDQRPVLGFFMAPIAIYYGSHIAAALIRKAAVGSYFSGRRSNLGNPMFDEPDQVSPMAGLGQIRTEGGDDKDLMFRATISSRPTGPGSREQDEIQRRPEGGPVRYDRDYHDSIFFPNLDYKDNKQIITQTYPTKVTDTYVFAGIGGLDKVGLR